MNAPRPRYQSSASPPSVAAVEQDEKDDDTKLPVWGCVQAILIIAVLAIAIAVLVLVIRTRGLAHSAFSIAKQANGTVNTKFGQFDADLSRLKGNVSDIGMTLTRLDSAVTHVQSEMASVTWQVGQLQSKVESLATQAFVASGYPSAGYSGSSGYSYGSGAGMCRAKSLFDVAVIWVVVEFAAALVG